MNYFMTFFECLVIVLLPFIYFWNAATPKGSLKKTQPLYSATFFTKTPPYKTFKIITDFAKQNGYQIDDINELQLALILNERMTMTSWGFLYPIYITEQIVGRTMIEVGITSKLGKFFQIGPLNKQITTLHHENMINAVKDAVLTDDSID